MKKLLYITDQQEYSEHGSIGPLFYGHLTKYVEVHMVYFTKFKHSFQAKGLDYVVPDQYKKDLCSYLEKKGVELASFDFVFVRNMEFILKNVLKNREKYGYKVGFRASFPKTVAFYESQKAEATAGWFSGINTWYRSARKRKLINQCDLFMPTSIDMQEAFYGDKNLRCFPLPAGLDPERIKEHTLASDEATRFIYVGTLDKLRQFERVLEAFEKIASKPWHLTVSTFDLSFAKNILTEYPAFSERIDVVRAENLDELTDQINGSDVGIALLPRSPLFDTAIAAKVMDYYTCAVPAILTDNPKNRTLFDEGEAIYSTFEVDAIAACLAKVIDTPRDELAAIGGAGQKKILGMKRNYEIMAKELAEVLESL
jgi:glycosyltransferase involved in cell wall biosynthesis